MNKEDIKGIIFDLDGVILDSEYYHWQGWVIPLRDLGMELTKDKYFDYAGKREDEIEEKIIKDFSLNIEKGALLAKKKATSKELTTKNKVRAMDYGREAVEYFTGNPKFKTILCSGGYRDEIMVKLENNGFAQYFPLIVCGTEVKRGKPWPDVYLLAVEKLGLKPEECLAFEDTQWGIESAKAAGVYCFAIPTEYSVKQDISKADKILTSLKEAVEFFEK